MDAKDIENEVMLHTLCLIYEITKIEVTFSGGGDSGSMDDVDISVRGQHTSKEFPMDIWSKGDRTFDPVTRDWVVGEREKVTTTINKFIEDYVDDQATTCDVDWWNNDGGYGHWTWTPAGIDFEVCYRRYSFVVGHEEHRQLGKEA